MGGCSSKPKTAEFEAAMAVQEDKPQDDSAAGINETIDADGGLKGTDKEQKTFESCAHSAFPQDDCSDRRGMRPETNKNSITGSDGEVELKTQRQVAIRDDCKSVKQLVDEETIHDFPIVEKDLKVLASESSQLPKDSNLSNVCSTELQERSMSGAVTVNSQEGPFPSCNEMPVQPVVREYKTSTAKEDDEGVSHFEEKALSLENNIMRSENDVYMEAERPLELQDSAVPEGMNLEQRKDSDTGDENVKHMLVASPQQEKQVDTLALESQDTPQHAREGLVASDSQDTVHDSEGQGPIDSPEQKSQPEKCNDCEMTTNGIAVPDNYTEETGKDVGNDVMRLEEGQRAKDEAIKAENFVFSPSNQQSYSCSLDNGVHEQQMQGKIVGADTNTCGVTVVKLQGEPNLKDLRPAAHDLQQETAVESASDDSWCILEKVDVEEFHSSSMAKEDIYMDMTKEADGVPRETSRPAGTCDKQVADSLVKLAMKEKPQAQPVHGMGPIGLVFKEISAQEIPARDIDDVLEKLASEFERQESLARSTP